MSLETIGQLLDVGMQRFERPQGAKVITVSLMLFEADDLSLAQLHQQGDISFANRSAEFTSSGEGLGLR